MRIICWITSAVLILASQAHSLAQDRTTKTVAAKFQEVGLLGRWDNDCTGEVQQQLYVDRGGKAYSRLINISSNQALAVSQAVSLDVIGPSSFRLTLLPSGGEPTQYATFLVLGNKMKLVDLRDRAGAVIVENGRKKPSGFEQAPLRRCDGDATAKLNLDAARPQLQNSQLRAADPAASQGQADEWDRFLTGKSFEASAPDGGSFKMTLSPDGNYLREPTGGGRSSRGTWRKNGRELCTKFPESAETCFTIRKSKLGWITRTKGGFESTWDQPAGAIAATSQSRATEINFSLRTGDYIHANVPCDQGSNATLLTFDGRKFSGARNFCVEVDGLQLKSALKVKPCRKSTDEDAEPTGSEETFTIKNSTEFSTGISKISFRWCQGRAELPQANAPSKSGRSAVIAALRREHGEKIILRGGRGLGGYALYSWTDPTTDTGGQSLLRYDGEKSDWILLDSDGGGLDLQRLLSKGVPQNIASDFVSGNSSAGTNSPRPSESAKTSLTADTTDYTKFCEEIYERRKSTATASRDTFIANCVRTRRESSSVTGKVEAPKVTLANPKQQLRSGFMNQYGVTRLVSEQEIARNPFVFKGTVVGVRATFSKMVSESEAIFDFKTETLTFLTLSKVPTTEFRGNETVVLAIRVNGMKEGIPSGEYLGAFRCKVDCTSDFYD